MNRIAPNICKIALLIIFPMVFTPLAWAQQESAPGKTEFNEAKLKEKIATRISTVNTAKGETEFPTDKVVVEKVIPFQLQDRTFFGARLKILPVTPDQKHDFLHLIVDRDIEYQYADIIRIDTGASEFASVMAELRRIELPAAGVGHEIYQGKGSHQVTLVSDPFCPYCRQVWGYLYQNRNKFKSFKLAHYPIHAASHIPCAVMMFAQKNRIDLLDIIQFSYTRLESSESPVNILGQYAAEFPSLKKMWGTDLQKAADKLQAEYAPLVAKEHSEIRDLGILGTPASFIDGYMVEGFNVSKFKELMQ